jgi:hypothetical protein
MAVSLCKQCEYWVGNGATPNISKIVCMVPEDYREVCPSFKRVKNPPAKPKEEPITITVESSLEYEDREEDYWV